MRTFSACILVLIVTLFSSCTKQGSSEADLLAVKQDNVTPYEQKRLNVLKAREFLWVHWQQRRPAFLVLTSVTKEGAKYRSEYRIINLPGNTFTLKVAVIHERVGAFGKVIPKPEGGYEAYTMERVVSDDAIIGPESKITVLQSSAVVAAEKYRLRFKGWGDAVVGYF